MYRLGRLKIFFGIVFLTVLLILEYISIAGHLKSIGTLTRVPKYGNFCVVSNVYNPVQYKSRYESYKRFAKYMHTFDVQLVTVELAFQNQTFQITDSMNPNHIQLRTNDVMWYKENLINIGIRKSPSECVYIAWLDLELEFTNRNWIQDAIKLLDSFKIVQLFEVAYFLGPNAEILRSYPSAGRCQKANNINATIKELNQTFDLTNLVEYCHPGFAWASKKQTLLDIDGLFDGSIVGDGDNIAACAFRGDIKWGIVFSFDTVLGKLAQKWQIKANKYINQSLSSINGRLMHLWHGPFSKRGYIERRMIIMKSNVTFNPNEHVYYDTMGLLHFKPDGRKYFMDKIMDYFLNRDEDSQVADKV